MPTCAGGTRESDATRPARDHPGIKGSTSATVGLDLPGHPRREHPGRPALPRHTRYAELLPGRSNFIYPNGSASARLYPHVSGNARLYPNVSGNIRLHLAPPVKPLCGSTVGFAIGHSRATECHQSGNTRKFSCTVHPQQVLHKAVRAISEPQSEALSSR